MPFSLNQADILHNRYKIREQLGQGGMGSIYLAEDIRLEGRLCALKEIGYDRSLPANIQRQSREQFMREAAILARLDHASLPKVTDFFSNGSYDYLVMDYVLGLDLRTAILEARRKKVFLPEREVLDWANQLADVLIYLHGQESPIIHRNIKPDNLIITSSGILKLIDFSLAKILVPEEMTFTIVQGPSNLLYAPFEQCVGDDAHTDIRADIYSFGSTLYHLLTNEPPVDALKRFLDPSSLIPPGELNRRLSMRTQEAVLWAMSLHPDERPSSVEIFRESLMGERENPIASFSPYRLALNWSRTITPTEKILACVAVVLFLLSLIASLLH